MGMGLRIWNAKTVNKTLVLIIILIGFFLIKDFVFDKIIFKNENKIINTFYSDGEKFVVAIMNNDKELINTFLEKDKVSVNYVDGKKKISLLIWALSYKNYDLSKQLINKGADVNTFIPKNGLTPLHIASADGKFELVQMLVSKGANIYARDDVKHFSALDFASENQRSEIVSYLNNFSKK